MQKTVNQISEQLLLAVKMNEPYIELLEELKKLPIAQLKSQLNTDTNRKAFWINVYNAHFQIFRKDLGIEKSEIYKARQIKIAGEEFSLDDVEHGILRKYRYKFSLGYLPNPFFRKIIKDLSVNEIDFRIHFALNCGAASCPPIAFYSSEKLETQLEIATLSFLEGETDIKEAEKEIHVTQLFKWFLGDFGGKGGIRSILEQYLKIKTNGYRLVYKPYSWEEELDNYAEGAFG